jgi:hypothetical protein
MIDEHDTEHAAQRALAWAERLRERGWGEVALAALDALEPLTPLGAQMLWIAQPTLRLWGGGALVGELARLLESPEGVALLRDRLQDGDDPADGERHGDKGE